MVLLVGARILIKLSVALNIILALDQKVIVDLLKGPCALNNFEFVRAEFGLKVGYLRHDAFYLCLEAAVLILLYIA